MRQESENSGNVGKMEIFGEARQNRQAQIILSSTNSTCSFILPKTITMGKEKEKKLPYTVNKGNINNIR